MIALCARIPARERRPRMLGVAVGSVAAQESKWAASTHMLRRYYAPPRIPLNVRRPNLTEQLLGKRLVDGEAWAAVVFEASIATDGTVRAS
jgi:hypothetical protein